MSISISSGTDLAASSYSPPAASKGDTPEKILGVAKQFEALMIGQILKSARESSGGGWLGGDDDKDDQSSSLVMELGEQGLSQAMAAHGGLGIAKMVTQKLAKTPSSDSATLSTAPASPPNSTGFLKRR
jgi:flagellar protein FlgJ